MSKMAPIVRETRARAGGKQRQDDCEQLQPRAAVASPGGFSKRAIQAAMPAGIRTRETERDRPVKGKGERVPDAGAKAAIFGLPDSKAVSPSAQVVSPPARSSRRHVDPPPMPSSPRVQSSPSQAPVLGVPVPPTIARLPAWEGTPPPPIPPSGGFGPASTSRSARSSVERTPTAPASGASGIASEGSRSARGTSASAAAAATHSPAPPTPPLYSSPVYSSPVPSSAASTPGYAQQHARRCSSGASSSAGVGASPAVPSNHLGGRLHAQDLHVIPTAAARAMLGYGGARGIAGLVPAGRDGPIGLEIARFLGSSNPFGQDPFAKPKAKQDEEEVIRALVAPADAMSQVLHARLSHLKVLAALWTGGGGPAKALQRALDTDDPAVLVDLLGATHARLHVHVSLDLATDLASAVQQLLDSEYEDYLLVGLSATQAILKGVCPVLRGTAEAVSYQQSFFRQGGVDIHLEEKQERCAAVAEALAALQPRLEALASAKGRSAQLATRVHRSLLRALGTAI